MTCMTHFAKHSFNKLVIRGCTYLLKTISIKFQLVFLGESLRLGMKQFTEVDNDNNG